jgi:NAD(P)-dependent dehydrogenase (short-subunit alcohol dehydrogenase family)
VAELSGQTILISGAAGGLGGVAAVALAQRGATIVLLDKNIPGMESVYDRIAAAGGPQPAMYPFDLAGASESQYLEMAGAIEKKYGSLQGLLHSAAVLGVLGPIATLDTASWGHTLNVNLNAAFLLTRVLLPLLQKSAQASIVFTSDSALQAGKAYTGAYGVSKLALQGLAKTLAEELQSAGRVRVNTLVPGPVNSPLRNRAYPAEDKTRLAEPASLAECYVYLFGPQSAGVTGRVITAPLS